MKTLLNNKSNITLTDEDIIQKIYLEDNPPYKNSREFMDDIAKLEDENIKAILVYNSNYNKLNSLSNEINHFTSLEMNKAQNEKNQESSILLNLEEIIVKNKKLKEKLAFEKLSVKSGFSSENNLVKKSIHSYLLPKNSGYKITKNFSVSNKILVLFEKCKNFVETLNEDKDSHSQTLFRMKHLLVNLKLDHSDLEKLKFIEYILGYLTAKYSFLKSNKEQKLRLFEDDLASVRKEKQAKDLKREIQINEQRQIDRILEKYNKAHNIQARKIFYKSKPIIKEKKKNEIKIAKSELCLDDMFDIKNDFEEKFIKTEV
jgi:hypothetical protein